VEFVERIIPKRVPRVYALLIVYIALIAVITAALIPVGSRISREAVRRAKSAGGDGGDPLANIPIPRWLEPLRPQFTTVLRDRISEMAVPSFRC